MLKKVLTIVLILNLAVTIGLAWFALSVQSSVESMKNELAAKNIETDAQRAELIAAADRHTEQIVKHYTELLKSVNDSFSQLVAGLEARNSKTFHEAEVELQKTERLVAWLEEQQAATRPSPPG